MELSRRRVAVALAKSVVFIGALTLLVSYLSGFGNESSYFSVEANNTNDLLSATTHRKLLDFDKTVVRPERSSGEKCVVGDIVINQGPTGPLPSGIPTYTVEIMNSCFTGCKISRIHLKCGWFSSNNLINPKVFKRIAYDDCLVNDGEPLLHGGVISFQYSTTFQFPLKVSSIYC